MFGSGFCLDPGWGSAAMDEEDEGELCLAAGRGSCVGEKKMNWLRRLGKKLKPGGGSGCSSKKKIRFRFFVFFLCFQDRRAHV